MRHIHLLLDAAPCGPCGPCHHPWPMWSMWPMPWPGRIHLSLQAMAESRMLHALHGLGKLQQLRLRSCKAWSFHEMSITNDTSHDAGLLQRSHSADTKMAASGDLCRLQLWQLWQL
jgi:hypothetical protein